MGGFLRRFARFLNQPWTRGLLFVYVLTFILYFACAFIAYPVGQVADVASILAFLLLAFHFPNCVLRRGGRAGKAGMALWALFKAGLEITTALLAGFCLHQGRQMAYSDIVAILTGDYRDISEFLSYSAPGVLLYALPFLAAFAALFALHLALLRRAPKPAAEAGVPWAALAVFLAALAVVAAASAVAPALFVRQTLMVRRSLAEELRRYRESEAVRAAAMRRFHPRKDGEGEISVLVIGESVSRRYMGCYGYPHDNTPFFSALHAAGKLTLLRGHSCGVMTNYVAPRMLGLANAYNGVNLYGAPSLIEMCNAAGIKTCFLSNHTKQSTGMLLEISRRAGRSVFLYGVSSHDRDMDSGDDSQLLRLLQDYVDDMDPRDNQFIVLHLVGSHAPYERRVPASFRSRQSRDDFASEKEYYYSRSIEYTDDILRRAVDLLERKAAGPLSLVYAPDHGESTAPVFRADELAAFRPEFVEIPVAVYLSASYRERYPERAERLEAGRDRLISNDLLPWLVSGLFGLRWDGREEEYDLSSERYAIGEGTIRLFSGRLTFENGEYVEVPEEPPAGPAAE